MSYGLLELLVTKLLFLFYSAQQGFAVWFLFTIISSRYDFWKLSTFVVFLKMFLFAPVALVTSFLIFMHISIPYNMSPWGLESVTKNLILYI